MRQLEVEIEGKCHGRAYLQENNSSTLSVEGGVYGLSPLINIWFGDICTGK